MKRPAYVITISRQRVNKTRQAWVVSEPKIQLKGRSARGRTGPVRGEVVEWCVASAGVSAYLQFTDMHLFQNVPGKHRLTKDMTARVTYDEPLRLVVRGYQGDSNRRKRHHYAVWMEESPATPPRLKSGATPPRLKSGAKAGSGFALGHTLNPPPEINLGP